MSVGKGFEMKRVTYALILFVAVVTARTAGAQDEAGCYKARLKAAAKYASCQLKEAAAAGAPAVYKCPSRYASIWTKLQSKYPTTVCAGSRYQDQLDGTILDNLTGLVWAKKQDADGNPNLANVHDADNVYTVSTDDVHADGAVYTDFLNSLNAPPCTAAHCDWRLPSLHELATLLKNEYPCEAAPCVDAAILPLATGLHLSSTISSTGGVATIDLYSSTHAAHISRLDAGRAIAVRGGL